MLPLILNVVFVLIAIAMIALILMQRGAGAQAGSGFGGGASATVFGSRGASNFLSKSTKWLAISFFAITLFMAWQATNSARQQGATQVDLGVMSEVPAAPAPVAAPQGAVPAAPTTVPEQSPVPSAPDAQPPADAPAQPVPAQEGPQGG
ncbi:MULTISPECIES: preprotein translocase subunit SecG [unclassified Luteimonas]|uniref:preprotein translocase subunit SecG n=1 Tax=unclassified Luteimonas TaxID=2629088 RepID=UPI0018F0AD63|nr:MULTISPECIES: preprotein translocase subunit SecG [unclassified Luteimonas]MBJ6980776.1 preprotein translocase subunit SecG [Luteimonas sp. MC1572]MBJ7573960.1 preprotein translocase subunit SecG [Luteimonas sp. MC1828]QQO02143.1 preprotein translocase subunit SecG [Luteimonas sp. MC1572]